MRFRIRKPPKTIKPARWWHDPTVRKLKAGIKQSERVGRWYARQQLKKKTPGLVCGKAGGQV